MGIKQGDKVILHPDSCFYGRGGEQLPPMMVETVSRGDNHYFKWDTEYSSCAYNDSDLIKVEKMVEK